MRRNVNIQKTCGGSITVALPKDRTRSPNYPFEFLDPPVEVLPTRPDPTFTFWKKPNDTFPTGTVVYFIYCAGRIKIGITNFLPKRLDQVRCHSPLPAVAILLVSGSYLVEREFHERFAAERKHGEWFILSQKMRNFFKARLCPVGRASLRTAEEDFDNYCKVERP